MSHVSNVDRISYILCVIIRGRRTILGVCKGGSWNPKIPISNGVKSQIPISIGVKSQIPISNGVKSQFQMVLHAPFSSVSHIYLVFRIRILKQNLNWDIGISDPLLEPHFFTIKSLKAINHLDPHQKCCKSRIVWGTDCITQCTRISSSIHHSVTGVCHQTLWWPTTASMLRWTSQIWNSVWIHDSQIWPVKGGLSKGNVVEVDLENNTQKYTTHFNLVGRNRRNGTCVLLTQINIKKGGKIQAPPCSVSGKGPNWLVNDFWGILSEPA